VSAVATKWVLQLYALEHHDGRRMIHLTKELLGDATEGVLSVELPVVPSEAVAEFAQKNEASRLFDHACDFAVIVKTFAGYLLDEAGQLSWSVEQARALNRSSFLLWVLADMEVSGTFVPEAERHRRAEEYADLWSLHPTEAHIENDAAFFAELGRRALSTFAASKTVIRSVVRQTFPKEDWTAVEAIVASRAAAPPLLAARRLMPGKTRRGSR
jgi:hypothetical protein